MEFLSLLNELLIITNSRNNYEKILSACLQKISESFGFSTGLVTSQTSEILALWQKDSANPFIKSLFSPNQCIDENLESLLKNQIQSAAASIVYFPDLSLDSQHPLYILHTLYNITSIAYRKITKEDNSLGLCCFLHHEPILFDKETFQQFVIIINIFHDWLASHLQSDKLQKDLQRLTDVMKIIPLNVIICDQNQKILQSYVNPTFKSAIKPCETQYLCDILPMDIFDSIVHNLHLITKVDRKSISYTISSDTLNTTYEVIITSISNNEIVILMNDITRYVEAERCNVDFISLASHELRSPLTTMLLVADLIQEGGTPEELQHHWQILRHELEREKNLVEKLLMVGRLESGDLKLRFTSIDVSKEIKKSIQTIQPLAAGKNITIKASISKKLPSIQADPIGINQIFNNILNNAVKYSYNNSTISIIAKPYLKQNQDKQEAIPGVRISIRDHGIGIPNEDIPKLFQRYFRAKNAIQEDISGSGIGLYVVKSIIDEHKGNINISSKLNEGTVVTIWLPCNQNQ